MLACTNSLQRCNLLGVGLDPAHVPVITTLAAISMRLPASLLTVRVAVGGKLASSASCTQMSIQLLRRDVQSGLAEGVALDLAPPAPHAAHTCAFVGRRGSQATNTPALVVAIRRGSSGLKSSYCIAVQPLTTSPYTNTLAPGDYPRGPHPLEIGFSSRQAHRNLARPHGAAA